MTPANAEQSRRWVWLALAAALWAVDQAIKYGVVLTMPLYTSLPIFPGFNWVYVLNPGAAFSFLADAGGWQRYFFTGLAIIVSAVLTLLLWRGVCSKLEALAYSLLIAGAMGNGTDRVSRGAVVDYLNFYWGDWHWPAFNLADINISAAAMLLLYGIWQQSRSPPADGAPQNAV